MTDMEINRLEDAARRVFGGTEMMDDQPTGRERSWLSRTLADFWSARIQSSARAHHQYSAG